MSFFLFLLIVLVSKNSGLVKVEFDSGIWNSNPAGLYLTGSIFTDSENLICKFTNLVSPGRNTTSSGT